MYLYLSHNQIVWEFFTLIKEQERTYLIFLLKNIIKKSVAHLKVAKEKKHLEFRNFYMKSFSTFSLLSLSGL
jgi:hypothetical protein